jgi:hypothetical protein
MGDCIGSRGLQQIVVHEEEEERRKKKKFMHFLTSCIYIHWLSLTCDSHMENI